MAQHFACFDFGLDRGENAGGVPRVEPRHQFRIAFPHRLPCLGVADGSEAARHVESGAQLLIPLKKPLPHLLFNVIISRLIILPEISQTLLPYMVEQVIHLHHVLQSVNNLGSLVHRVLVVVKQGVLALGAAGQRGVEFSRKACRLLEVVVSVARLSPEPRRRHATFGF